MLDKESRKHQVQRDWNEDKSVHRDLPMIVVRTPIQSHTHRGSSLTHHAEQVYKCGQNMSATGLEALNMKKASNLQMRGSDKRTGTEVEPAHHDVRRTRSYWD